MRLFSAFSGVGGFDLAFKRCGWEIAGYSEIEKFCCEVYHEHFPESKCYGDICEIKGKDIGVVDCIVGGFPCQDLSVAGRRAGLSGERSGVFFELARLIDEAKPSWVVLENVPGLLSSHKGRDMAAVLGTLSEIGYCVAWRVLDSRYFGVAQRRRRVFFVGSLGNGSAVEVLFESESLSRNPETRK